jgi:hypothetical protein
MTIYFFVLYLFHESFLLSPPDVFFYSHGAQLRFLNSLVGLLALPTLSFISHNFSLTCYFSLILILNFSLVSALSIFSSLAFVSFRPPSTIRRAPIQHPLSLFTPVISSLHTLNWKRVQRSICSDRSSHLFHCHSNICTPWPIALSQMTACTGEG